jgi:hypothetical protein
VRDTYGKRIEEVIEDGEEEKRSMAIRDGQQK